MAYNIKPKGYGKGHDWILRIGTEEMHFKTKKERDKYARAGRILWDYKGDIEM